MKWIVNFSKKQNLARQKQLPRDDLTKRRSENMQRIYRRKPMPKCKITLRHGCSPVNLLRIFRTPFPKNTSEGLLLAHLPSPLFLSIRHGRVDRLERNNDTLHSLILQYTGLKGNTIIKSMNHNNKHISPIDLKTQVRYTSRKLGAKFQINDPVNMIQYITANVQNHLAVRTA